MSGTPIREVELFAVRMDFSDLAKQAMSSTDNGLGMALDADEPWDYGDFLLARVADENGVEGWGEVFMWLPETGVSSAEVTSTISSVLSRYVLGADPSQIRALRRRMDRNITRNEVAKGLLEMACLDLAARQVQRPVSDLLGGRCASSIPLCGLVPLASPSVTALLVSSYVEMGYGTVRVKLGTSPEVDYQAIAAARQAVGTDIKIRLDFNQAYGRADALRVLRLLEPLGIEAAEQPLKIGDLVGMVELQRRVDIPLFLHEGAFNAADVVGLVEMGGCGVIGLNAERPGGILRALELIDYGALRGMGTIIHNQPLGVGTATLLHLAAARADVLGHAVEIAGDMMFAESLVTDRPAAERGHLAVPDGPGWGVTMDRDALDRWQHGASVKHTR